MKYIFIDANVYRNLFSDKEGFTDDIKNLLDRLIDEQHANLLMPVQVRDEVERNRAEKWFCEEVKEVSKSINSNKRRISRFEKSPHEEAKEELETTKKELEEDEEKFQKIERRYRALDSKANQKLKGLLGKSMILPENEELIDRARLRIEKGNYPKDDKLGDALIWETLLDFLEGDKKNSTLVFVSNDKKAWGQQGFNPWLKQEFIERTGMEMFFTYHISDIKGATKEEQEKMRDLEREENKKIALFEYQNCYGYVEASRKMDNLIQYKDILTRDDYKVIIEEALEKSSIVNSYFTPYRVRMLLTDGGNEDDELLGIIDFVDDKMLQELNKIYGLHLVQPKYPGVPF